MQVGKDCQASLSTSIMASSSGSSAGRMQLAGLDLPVDGPDERDQVRQVMFEARDGRLHGMSS